MEGYKIHATTEGRGPGVVIPAVLKQQPHRSEVAMLQPTTRGLLSLGTQKIRNTETKAAFQEFVPSSAP